MIEKKSEKASGTGLLARLTTMQSNGDFVGIGNLILETLMRPGQDFTPDADSWLLAERIDAIVAARFNLPESITYGRPYRDKHIAYWHRNVWGKDQFVQLIIMAFVLGATLENLPPPHTALLRYYRETATSQLKCIVAAVNQFAARPRPAHTFPQREFNPRNPEDI